MHQGSARRTAPIRCQLDANGNNDSIHIGFLSRKVDLPLDDTGSPPPPKVTAKQMLFNIPSACRRTKIDPEYEDPAFYPSCSSR